MASNDKIKILRGHFFTASFMLIRLKGGKCLIVEHLAYGNSLNEK